MKIVLIHGQSHKGTTYHIGRRLTDKLETEENITEFFLPRDMPYFCNGCYRCLQNEEACPHYNVMEPILKSMDEAELLVFTTPVYCLRATGAMKSFLDHCFIQWLSHRPKAVMYHKKAVVIAAAAGAGTKKAADDIVTSLKYWGISDISVYGLRSLSKSWSETSDKIKAEIEVKTDKLVAKIKRKKKPGHASIGTRFMFYMMRMVQLKGWAACPEDNTYWKEKGWLGKERPWKKGIANPL